MYLFIDTISTPATYILFNMERDIVSQELLELSGRESEYFLVSLLEFLAKNNLEYRNLEWVTVVNGPGSFTAMRIITLTINTLSFVHHIPLYGIDYFTLSELAMRGYPVLLRANRGEYLVQRKKNNTPELLAISDVTPGDYFGIGDINDFTSSAISIQSGLRYDVVCKNIRLTPSPPLFKEMGENRNGNAVLRIEPLYIKKPNIT